MFLKKLIQRNPEFIKATIGLHQEGKIPPIAMYLIWIRLVKMLPFWQRRVSASDLKYSR